MAGQVLSQPPDTRPEVAFFIADRDHDLYLSLSWRHAGLAGEPRPWYRFGGMHSPEARRRCFIPA